VVDHRWHGAADGGVPAPSGCEVPPGRHFWDSAVDTAPQGLPSWDRIPRITRAVVMAV
jgi:hypothetical protein